jgi:sulfide:quinone oxidoreductase
MSDPAPQPLHVVIAGGGIAALEALLGLHDVGKDRVRVTVVSPREEFVLEPLRPTAVMGDDLPPRHSLRMFTRRFGAAFRRDALRRVLPEEHEIECVSGQRLAYDVLLVALGARRRAVSPYPITYGCESRPGQLREAIVALERGAARSIAFVVPEGVGWPLPIYELALAAAPHARGPGAITVVSPEVEPLAVFGAQPSRAVAALLSAAGVDFVGSARPEFEPGAVVLGDGRRVVADVVVSLPLLVGPRVAGLPSDDAGFLVCDEHARVVGVPDVYAAGDATSFALKQGGIAAQQADAACEHIAARAGATVTPRPVRPVLRGKLLAPSGPLYLRNVLDDPLSPRASKALLWFPPSKVSGRYVSSWLESVDLNGVARRAFASRA